MRLDLSLVLFTPIANKIKNEPVDIGTSHGHCGNGSTLSIGKISRLSTKYKCKESSHQAILAIPSSFAANLHSALCGQHTQMINSAECDNKIDIVLDSVIDRHGTDLRNRAFMETHLQAAASPSWKSQQLLAGHRSEFSSAQFSALVARVSQPIQLNRMGAIIAIAQTMSPISCLGLLMSNTLWSLCEYHIRVSTSASCTPPARAPSGFAWFRATAHTRLHSLQARHATWFHPTPDTHTAPG